MLMSSCSPEIPGLDCRKSWDSGFGILRLQSLIQFNTFCIAVELGL